MTLDYARVWEKMNKLESVASKICSAREILDSAIESLESGNREKTETLLYAVDEFLQYYLEDFDRKFKTAWNETVVKMKEEDPCMPPWGHSDLEYLSKHKESLTCDKDDSSPECKGSWTSFWEENYYPEEYSSSQYAEEEQKEYSSYYYDYQRNDSNKQNPFVKKDKVKRWVLPVEEVENGDTGEQEYFITFPDDLLEAANLKEGDSVEYLDRGDGSYLLKKIENQMTYDEMIAAGWSMTDDGFWIKE